MKKLALFTGTIAMAFSIVGCNQVRRETGRVYMPDMSYSRAYETYASTEALTKAGVHYNARPVEGTVARGALAAYPFKNDSIGYARSAEVKNPLDPATVDLKEAERIYLINCGICHGAKLDGNGPLWKGGDGPYPAAPRNLISDPIATTMAEGTMYHSITYGKNLMGGYGPQLSSKQRWAIVTFIKTKQAEAAGAATATVK
ncbi:MAG: cytochrome c [Chitinophagaceae bacterium]|nr:cytochrome c [Chitinophagaceae bacterium]NCW88360.1 cytochrome c [Chitinophagia bacterium]NDE78589.1 cytochrome c [Chitinophagaceae bacterium]